jgi:A118 family predicted phage portal protein
VHLRLFDNKVVINEDSKLKIINHSALEIVPLSWDNNGKIIDVAFVDQYRIKDTDFVDLRIHVLEDDVYNIYNKKLKVFNNSTFEFIKDTSVIDKFYTGSNIPWFSVFKLPIVNNHDTKSPLGISVYGNAIDVLKNIDDAFNALTNEYKHSSKKIFYNKSMLNRDDEGRPIDPDSINKTLFYYVGDTESPSLSEDVPIKEFIPEIRVNKITEGLESALSYLSSLCGLGNNYYKFTGGSVVKTATEVISENSALFRNIKKNEIALEKFLIDFIHSILYVSNYALKTKFDLSTKISIKFDTSIIEDKAAIRDRDLKEVEAGIMTIEEYRNKWYNSARRDTTNNE